MTILARLALAALPQLMRAAAPVMMLTLTSSAQAQDAGKPGAGAPGEVNTLGAIATGRSSPPVPELLSIISSGLQADASREAALLAISGRGALPRFRPSAENAARWRVERTTLAALRPMVIQTLSDPSEKIRIHAVLAFATLSMEPDRLPAAILGGDNLAVLRTAYATERSVAVRIEIVKAAALCNDAGSERQDLLLSALRDEHPDVVAVGVRGVGAMRIPDALPTVVGLIRHDSARVRLSAAQAVAQYGAMAAPYIGDIEAAVQSEQDDIVKKTLAGTVAVIRKG